EDAGGLVGGEGLAVAVAAVLVVPGEVVQDAEAEVVAAGLGELAGLVAVVAGEVVDGADAAGRVPADAVAEALGEPGVDVGRALEGGEVGAVGFVGIVAVGVDDRAE